MPKDPSRISRRQFATDSILAAFSLSSVVSFLSGCLNSDESTILAGISDADFHYFDNNLTNLHFYFVNANIVKNELIGKAGQDCFMIVKIPQQHIAEQLFPESAIHEPNLGVVSDYTDNKKNARSSPSGFSYLSFQLFPGKPSKDERVISLKKIDILLQWDNHQLYDLVIPKMGSIKPITSDFNTYIQKNDLRFSENPVTDALGFFEAAGKQLLTTPTIPVTLLEIPKGLIVVPYGGEDILSAAKKKTITTKAIFSAPPLKKERFVYHTSRGKIIRAVQEIWNSQMWFQEFEKNTGDADSAYTSVGEKFNPSLRPGLYGLDDAPPDGSARSARPECNVLDSIWLPTFVDKQELTYIASLGRIGPNSTNTAGKEWNIETKGLTFTGLGAITKLHYKNFNSPSGTDLVEYEHHITMGRDEYIKVARIGVISVTGQRALHIKIGQRKIYRGLSYMDFKEYVEIIQKDLLYFDPKLFIADQAGDEPANYIQARGLPRGVTNTGLDEKISVIHSKDSLTDEADDTWWHATVWDKLPGQAHWPTDYKAWPFQRVQAITFVTEPISTRAGYCAPEDVIACGECAENNPLVFWPTLEKKDAAGKFVDATLHFRGFDWNNKPADFTSTFLFVRKSLIDNLNDPAQNLGSCLNSIYDNFFRAHRADRRHIHFVNNSIAFTPDQKNTAEHAGELPNKYNIAKTDSIEYYFVLCRENNTTLVLEEKHQNGSDITPIRFTEIFNERFFPLYPQMNRSILTLDGLPDSLRSVVEYNQSYRKYGFLGIDVNAANTKSVYNKARLIFDHTQKFINEVENAWEYDASVKKMVERPLEDGYTKIRQMFGNAGSKIGGMVNPDFDLQSIGLVKQGLAVGKEINEKYAKVKDIGDQISNFNPSDLFRQIPEIFHGVNLSNILKEVFPDIEAPINEIKNIAAQAENAIQDNKYITQFKTILNKAKQDIEELKKGPQGYEKILTDINAAEEKIKTLKNILNEEFQFADIQNLVNSNIEQYKSAFESAYTTQINIIEADVAKMIATNIISSVELISQAEEDIKQLNKYFSTLADSFSASIPEDVKAIALIKSFYATVFADTSAAGVTRRYVSDDFKIELKNLLLDANGVLAPYATVLANVTAKFTVNADNIKSRYDAYKNALAADITAQAGLVKGTVTIEAYRVTTTALATAKEAYDKLSQDLKARYSLIKKFLDSLLNEKSPAAIRLQGEILVRINKLLNVYELINSSKLWYYVEKFETLRKDYDALKSKIGAKKDPTGAAAVLIDDITGSGNSKMLALREQVIGHVAALKKKYEDDYGTWISAANANSKPLDQMVAFVNKEVKLHQSAINDYLDRTFYPEINEKVKASFVQIQAEGDKLHKEINGRITGLKAEYEQKKKEYEKKLNDLISQGGDSIANQVKLILDTLNEQILNDPDNVELINNLVEVRAFYNKLRTITQKEINFTWRTSSFRDADFGIVSFLASSNPKTTLLVDVRTTIFFQPDRFPSIVNRVETQAVNKLSNFGISLMKSMIINFDEVRFQAGSNQSPVFTVQIRDVQFTGAFAFVQAFESWLKSLMGDAFHMKITPLSVNIGYTLPIPSIGSPGFNFFNLTLNFDFWLHFNKKPMQFGFSLATADNKFGISVGIYAGFGFFSLIAEPKRGITKIEIALEFGGYFRLSLGPLLGEVKLAVGLYYSKEDDIVTIEGYIVCEGRVHLWIVMISARFYLGIRSRNNYVEGRCTVSYEVKLGCFFKMSFQASYYKKIAGATPGNDQSGSSAEGVSRLSASFAAASITGSQFKALSLSDQSEQVSIENERNVFPLSFKQWEDLMNSYKN